VRFFGAQLRRFLCRHLLTLRRKSPLGLPFGVILEGDTIGRPAAQQASVIDFSGVGLVELGDQRASGV
jgi:hypothetical protein